MKEPSKVRALKREDLPHVRSIVEANNMFPGDILEDMTAAYFAGEPGGQRWIVLDASGVKGVAYYVPEALTEGTWNLLMIAVDPGHHGQGIGSALMKHVETELAGQRERILLVETSGTADFERTRSFYRMLGYEHKARIRDFYAAGDDKIVFRKALV